MFLFLEDFIEGFRTKMAEESVFDLSDSAIFPRMESQAVWKFARKGKNLHLYDGNHVYVFHLPNGAHHEDDFHVTRNGDAQPTDFGRGMTETGIAQIHRSDPGSIYFTLQDGSDNPTYTFKHTGGDTWRGIPKPKKKKTRIIGDDFIKGAEDVFKYADFENVGNRILGGLLHGADTGTRMLKNTIMAPGFNPGKAALLGLGAGAAYDIGKRHLYNTPEENSYESIGSRALRYAAPAAGLYGLGQLTSSAFPDYYNLYPMYAN